MEYRFDDKHSFMEKLEEVFKSGVKPNDVKMVLPHPDHDIEHLVEEYTPASKLKFFTLAGGLTGCFTGFAFPSFTVLDWPLITGGKPLLSWPAWVVIAFELTILLGALASFTGMLFLSKLPRFSKMLSPDEYGNQYVLITDE